MSKKEFIFDELEYLGRIQYDKYHSLVERINLLYAGQTGEDNVSSIIKDLTQLITSRPQFIPAYEHLIPIMYELEGDIEAKALEDEAIQQSLSVVLDDNDEFPETLSWYIQENRPLIRMVFQHALICWVVGDLEEAKKMYQGLLDSNPHDNIGARFNLLGLLKKMNINEFDDKYYTEDDELMSKKLNWFEMESRNHKEFDGFWKVVVEEIEAEEMET